MNQVQYNTEHPRAKHPLTKLPCFNYRTSTSMPLRLIEIFLCHEPCNSWFGAAGIAKLLNSKEQVVAFSSIAKTEINNVTDRETMSLEYSLYNRFKYGSCRLLILFN